MEGLKRAAKALHKRAGEEEKERARNFFKDLDYNGDNKISMSEYLRGVEHTRLSNERFFHQLGSNADETLNFEDVLVVFYYNEKGIKIPRCNSCRELILGSSFSCFECLPNSHDDAKTLCWDCYGDGKSIDHNHSISTNLSDLQDLPVKLSQPESQERCFPTTPGDGRQPEVRGNSQDHHRPTNGQQNTEPMPTVGAMEELRKTAMLQYRASSPNVKSRAREFFGALDMDGDGKIKMNDYLSFMWEREFEKLCDSKMFGKLDMDGDGVLNFEEVMTLYYVIKSGRPHCSWCHDFIPEIFFTCFHCLNSKRSCILCRRCYQSADCSHSHSDSAPAQFLDNYTLLHTLNHSSLAPQPQPLPQSQPQAAEPSSSRAIVLTSGKTKMDVAYKALELAVAIFNTAATVAATVGTIATTRCTIM